MDPRRPAFPALLAGAAAIGLAPILVRYASTPEHGGTIGPTAAAFWRLLLALPFLAGGSALERRAPPSGRDRAVLLAAGLFFAADLGFWHYSILKTRIASATILACLAPVLVTLGSWLLFRDRLTPHFLGGLAAALAGAAVLMGFDPRQLLGNSFGILAAVFYAGYLLAIARLRARCSTAAVMAWSGLGASAGLLAGALLLGEPIVPSDARGWAVVAALALACQLGGQTLIAFALAHLPAAFAAVSLLVQPVVAAALGWWLFGEALGPWQFAGGVLVLAGIAVARRGALPRT